DPERGPAATVEWNAMTEAGNYGWPYCVGPNKPYVDYDFATETSGEEFDCVNGPTNASPNNTGLDRKSTRRNSSHVSISYAFSCSADHDLHSAVPPRRSSDLDPESGPAATVEWNAMTEAGKYGWPYCVGPNKPYVDYDFATEICGEAFVCVNGTTIAPPNKPR